MLGDVAVPLPQLTLDEAESSLLSIIKNDSFTIYYMTQSNKVGKTCMPSIPQAL